jgi:SAM-dependent methyltransferase
VTRARLPPDVVATIRRERVAPRWTDPHALHLRGLLAALQQAFASIAFCAGPVVDVFCGTQPYRPVEPWPAVWGLDLDDHFGAADLLGDLRTPFRTASLGGALCTQTLYLLDDDRTFVGEMARVLAPGGFVCLSVPLRFRREGLAVERRYSVAELRGLFAGWSDVTVHAAGGAGTGLAYSAGHRLEAIARRAPVLRPVVRVACACVNAIGAVVDVVHAPRTRTPATVVLTARRPAH